MCKKEVLYPNNYTQTSFRAIEISGTNNILFESSIIVRCVKWKIVAKKEAISYRGYVAYVATRTSDSRKKILSSGMRTCLAEQKSGPSWLRALVNMLISKILKPTKFTSCNLRRSIETLVSETKVIWRAGLNQWLASLVLSKPLSLEHHVNSSWLLLWRA